MRDINAEFLLRQFEAADKCGNQIDHQEDAHQVTTGQYRDFPIRIFRTPIDQQTFEIKFLNLVEPLVDLRHRADEYDDEEKRQAGDGQFKGSEELGDLLQHDARIERIERMT